MRATRYALFGTLTFLFFAVSLIAYAQTDLQFVPVTPCRLVDTRLTGGPIQAGTFRNFVIPHLGNCNIPTSAAAYSLNITVVPRGPLYFLTAWPTGEPQPWVSTLNSYDGRVKANAAIAVAGSSGAISIYVTNTTDVILDINGYFEPAIDIALAFYPLTPCRIADTRPEDGGGGPIQGETFQNFPVQGLCGVPTTAQSYSLNVTALPTQGPVYVVTAWPAGGPQPGVSTLNDYTGTGVANAALVGAGMGGDISVWVSNSSNMVIDINGYFAPPIAPPGTNGLSLYPVTPCRVIDTRSSGGPPFMDMLAPPVDVEHSPCMPPATAEGYVMNATVVPDGALGYLTLWPDGEPQATASTLNAWDGMVTDNMAIVPTNDGKINAYAGGAPTYLILDMSSYFAPLPPLGITTTSLPMGTVNVPYSSTLVAVGGEAPYSWSVTVGSLPPGLGLSSAGVISGTPTASGVYNFTVQVADTFNNMASAMLSITVQPGSLTITTNKLPPGNLSVPYSAGLVASGGMPPYTWSIVSGSLPAGLMLDSSTGVISGTPAPPEGTSNFTVQVSDSSSPPGMVTAPLSITIRAAITNAALQGPYAFSFSGYNNGIPVFMAGSFIADSNGNITSGVLDLNSASGGPPQLQGVPMTGTYSVQGNGLGTMTLTTNSQESFVFSVAISNEGISGTSRNGTLIQRDPSNPGSYGSGIILLQNSLNFSIGDLVGNYAFGYSGVDLSSKRVAGAGAYQMNLTGGLTNGEQDVNDNGTPMTSEFTGTFSLPQGTQTGRGTATLTINGGTNYVFYVVSSQQIIMMATDASPANLTLWSISQQQAPFTNSSLNGVGVVEVSGTDLVSGNPVSEAEAGLLTTNGGGDGSISLDQNDGGTPNQFTNSVVYSVATNGRVAFTSGFGANPPILYLFNRNQGFVVGTDSLVTTGILEAQSASPFTNRSISGTYLGGTVYPVLPSVTNSASWAFPDGNGHINLSELTSGPSGPGSSQVQDAYQVDGTGRTVLSLNGSPVGIMYVVSPLKFVLLPNGGSPVLSTFSLASID